MHCRLGLRHPGRRRVRCIWIQKSPQVFLPPLRPEKGCVSGVSRHCFRRFGCRSTVPPDSPAPRERFAEERTATDRTFARLGSFFHIVLERTTLALTKSSAVGLLVAFMPVESQRFALRAARESYAFVTVQDAIADG